MENNSTLFMTLNDYEKLSNIIHNANLEAAELLEAELDRATLVPSAELPHDVVSMNSKVEFIDLDTKEKASVTLVYPHEANIEEEKVSILAPIGSALIGLRVGQEISWPLPNGREKRIRVTALAYQPQAAGDDPA